MKGLRCIVVVPVLMVPVFVVIVVSMMKICITTYGRASNFISYEQQKRFK